MAFKHRYEDGWYKNAAGLYVQSEPIDASRVAAASTGQVVAKKSDGTLELITVSGGGGSAPQWVSDDARTPLGSPHAKSDAFPGSSLDAKWTQTNMTGATVSVARSRVTIATPSAGGVNFNSRLLSQPVEATPWSISARVILSATDDFHSAGLFVADATGKHVVTYLRAGGGDGAFATSMLLGYDYMTNVTTRSAFAGPNGSNLTHGIMWLRLRDNGTNLLGDWSWDGDFWVNFFSVSRTAFISGTQSTFGLYADNLSTSPFTAQFQNFVVENSA